MATSTKNIPTSFPSLHAHISLLTASAFILFLLPITSSDYFDFPNFYPTTTYNGALYQGDAVSLVGAVQFNSFTYLCRVGWATYAERVQLWDSKTGALSDFTTDFSFTIDTLGSPNYGHGLAFFLAPVGFQIPPNSAGGFLGLFNTTTSNSVKNQMVVVEFDSYPNTEWDPPYEHVGINNNSIGSVITTPWNASLHSGVTCDASIMYNASTKNLSVFWSYGGNSNSQSNSSLSYKIDLMEVLPEWVMVGFSAATGEYVEKNTLESWQFTSSFDTKTTSAKHAKDSKLMVGLTVSMGVLIFGGMIFIGSAVLRKRRRVRREKTEKMNLTSINDDLERGAGPRRFSYGDLVTATNNFSAERKLGEGGFGGVYKGYLNDLDMAVAVKKISRGSRQGKKEYTTEVKIISRLRHRNLVQLIGWCHDQGEFLLVYEFMPNGSLDAHLFGKKIPLTWAMRYKVTLGLASALLYLHEEWEQCVVHRDIKSSNIMLDSGFNVKLGDFGLARLMDHELGPQTTGLAGTLGYLAPEYISTGKASKEADVFSFGVVVLEIASGRKSIRPTDEESEIGLVEWVWDLYGRGQILSTVDERLKSNFDLKEVECLMIVGLWCAYPDHSLRPSIRQAIQALHFEAPMPNLPKNMPVPMYQVPRAPTSRFEDQQVASSSEPMISCTSIDTGR
ncbi:L-type lectin-domain containing receptor kinase IX.1-like [Rhododendron vialii]|uniref:L-type lectin-domain containing receptor kinase IX.1-like n=1 Tax=Rhododendron vialii TaxID=182163 RepID=UPI00265F9175|nr:L-type lectin-domain containing receptor kinase IX.1-like [Rhododendron vialii]